MARLLAHGDILTAIKQILHSGAISVLFHLNEEILILQPFHEFYILQIAKNIYINLDLV